MSFRRKSKNAIVAGVCSGLEDYTGSDRNIWRVIFVFPWHALLGWFIYLALALFTDED